MKGQLFVIGALVVLLPVGVHSPSSSGSRSCRASVARVDATEKFSTAEEAVRAEITSDGEQKPTTLRIVFRFPDSGVHDVRMLAVWESRSEHYAASGIEREGTVEWRASGPIRFC